MIELATLFFEQVIDQYVIVDKREFMLGQLGYVTIFEIFTSEHVHGKTLRLWNHLILILLNIFSR